MKFGKTIFCAAALAACPGQAGLSAAGYFKISVVDEQTGRGVPLMELETVSAARWWTDSNGIAAFDEPGLMGAEVFFHVRGHGYEYPKDGFGFSGVKLKPEPNGAAVIKVRRVNIAERLYRVTGEGIYRDSLLTGEPAPTRRPLLNAQVAGQDTALAAPYRGKLYWFWGDTNRMGYPLGHFGAAGAVSELPALGGLPPDTGVDLAYFTDASGFSKQMCPLPGDKEGLRWIESIMTVPDEHGVERLVARMANMRDLEYAYDWRLMVFNDEKEVFESVRRWDIHEGHDAAHPFRADVNGTAYYYIYPNWRVRADYKSLFDLENYEAFTCVAGEGRVNGKRTAIDRDGAGRPLYSWKKGADRLSEARMRELAAAGVLKPEESWLDLHDAQTGARIQAGRGSVYWNAYCGRWVMLISAQPGEIWFAEGDTPTGPWVYARRVVAHDKYNFYNPTQHPFFDSEGGRLIYFEGTYTDAFSGAKDKTPRYDYNQIMYRLTLDDARLSLPAPVYRLKNGLHYMREGITEQKAWNLIEEAAFYAIPPARARPGLVPVFAAPGGGLSLKAAAGPAGGGAGPLFLALAPEGEPGEEGAAAAAPLYEYERRDGTRLYATDPGLGGGLKRAAKPLCRVWRNPQTALALDPETAAQ